jgi:hypothetical protein
MRACVDLTMCILVILVGNFIIIVSRGGRLESRALLFSVFFMVSVAATGWPVANQEEGFRKGI